MPSKENICVIQEPIGKSFLSTDVEELVAAIKHNLQLKSRPRHSTCKRVSPYSAPVRSACRNTDHDTSNCNKCCLLRTKASCKDSDDPYEILTLLSKGILISEAVRRLQKETNRSKKSDFYDSAEDFEVGSV